MRTFNASVAVEAKVDQRPEGGAPSACDLLRELAAATWRDIQEGDESGIRMGEESITDYLLLRVKRRFPLPTWVTKWNRLDEGRRTGADFDWWFVDPVDLKGVALRIQAKRIDYFREEFVSLRKGKPQLDLLERSALQAGLHPVYLFYLASRLPRAGLTGCGSFGSAEAPPGWGGAPNEIHGCSLVATAGVKAALNQKVFDLDFFWPLLLPWSCLVCCEGFGGSLVERIDAQARRLRRREGGADEELSESLITDEILPEVWAVLNPGDREFDVDPPDVGATMVTLAVPNRPVRRSARFS